MMSFLSNRAKITGHISKPYALHSKLSLKRTQILSARQNQIRGVSSKPIDADLFASKPHVEKTSDIIEYVPGNIELFAQNIASVNHSILEAVNSIGGLSWFTTIIVTTFTLRAFTTLPIAIYQQRKIGKLIALKPVLEAWANTFKRTSGTKPLIDPTSILFLQRGVKAQYKRKVQQLYKDHGYSPLALYSLPFIQIPLFFSMSLTIRSMSSGTCLFGWETLSKFNEPAMTMGGPSWLYDLTQQDPTMILPLSLVAIHLMNIELSTLLLLGQTSLKQKVLTNIARGLGIFMFPIAAVSPMALSVFWITSASFSIVQTILLRIALVRRILKLPAISIKASL